MRLRGRNMGGRGGDINAPNKYASGREEILQQEAARNEYLQVMLAKAKSEQEAVKNRWNAKK